MSARLIQRVVAKIANYTLNPVVDSPGTVFTNAEAVGAVIFTLPSPVKAIEGWWYEFLSVVDQVITVASPVADTLIAFNDLTADSVSSGASGQRIGALIKAKCVKTATGTYRWVVENGTQGITFIVTS